MIGRFWIGFWVTVVWPMVSVTPRLTCVVNLRISTLTSSSSGASSEMR
ncbi:MAG: hypothetical protein ACREBD_12440 [Blastocatellia bacterium]